MAANMQHMAGPGQMMPQQLRRPNSSQVQQLVYQNLVQNTPPPNSLGWQANMSINDRMGKTLNLITNISLAMTGVDYMKAADFGCQFERDVFQKAPNKDSYDQLMNNKTMEFFRKRQANESNIQNSLNASAQAQAQAQARAMMNLQAQMGRGMGQGPQQGQGFQQFQQSMPQQPPQPQQQPQQQQQQQPPQAQQQMGMPNQAGRGMPPNQQMMNMAGAQARPPQQFPTDMSRLAQSDKAKVAELAAKMMAQAPEHQKSQTRQQLQQRMTPQQLAEFQAQGRDPLVWFFQSQALQALRNSMNRFPQGTPNQNANQATMMQQQQSQQSLQQQRQNMMNGGVQPDGSGDFTQFTTNMESIKDQQISGLIAQQAGQMVVPASNPAARNATPQPINQNMMNQQGPNQVPRPQQPGQQPQQAQGQMQQNMHLQQQMKMNQNAQQSQLQAQQQMKQMQGGQANMGGGMPPAQSPAMDTLNTPVSRPPANMNPMTTQGMGSTGVQFGDQRFNQGIQRPNNQAFNTMLANMSQEQRQQVMGLPPDKLNEMLRRWQTSRQEMVNSQMGQNQMGARPQNQMGQMNPNMTGLGPQNVQQQPGQIGNAAQQMQPQMQRMAGAQSHQAQAMMDQMDLPPQVINQIGQLPPDVKKWRDLKMWLSQNNSLPQNVRSQLGALQHKQFQLLMQKRAANGLQAQPQVGQNGNINPGMAGQQMMANQQNGIQRPMGNIPPQVMNVTPQEMMHYRNTRPGLAQMSDDQLRGLIQQMKKANWLTQQQQQQQLRGPPQPGAQDQGPQGPQNPMSVPQAPMQTPAQAIHTPQPQAQPGPNTGMGQTMQQPGPKPTGPTPEQIRRQHAAQQQQQAQQQQAQQQAQQAQQQQQQQQQQNNRAQGPTPSPAQPPKNLKRSSPDNVTEVPAPTAAKSAATARPPSQPGQQNMQKQIPQLTPQQIANLTSEQRIKYENYVKLQMNKGMQSMNQVQPSSESLNRLKALGQEEQRQFNVDVMPDIPMSPQEYADTASKLQRIVQDMTKLGRGLSKWYAITRDDARAKMFFRTRLRIIKQFADGEATTVLKDKFSIRSSELDQARAMLESMAKDLIGRSMIKPNNPAQAPQGTPQNQTAQLPQQQGQPAAMNAGADKDAQAAGKNQIKTASKNNQAPPAPTTTQAPPFPFGASPPQGTPSYPNKPAKDMNLQLPPRKKTKFNGQTGQGATPSPQISNALPEGRRPSESQMPNKPMILCQDLDCNMSTAGFLTEQALQKHIEEEHTRPRENPVKFVQENLALALGLEPDGTLKKEQKLAMETAPGMSATLSKQGQTPGNIAGTPASQDAMMKRSASAMGKPIDLKSISKADATPKLADATITPAMLDPWAGSTIDPQSLLSNLGFEKGIPGVVSDITMYRSLTPNDTPESSKDSGSSEPNSDISEGATLDIDVNWQNIDTDLLLDLGNATLDGELSTLDATLDPSLLDTSSLPPPDWDDMNIDFTKPFQLDTSFYSMAT